MSAMTVPGRPVIERKHFNKIALIDADKLKHLVCYEVYKLMKQNYPREEININYLIDDQLNRIHNMFSAKAMVFCFSGKSYNTFRYSAAVEKEYKGNRKVENDTTYYDCKSDDMKLIVSYIMQTNIGLIFSDLEADDLLSMLQSDDTFIFSNDKDLNQIPGLHFDPGKLDLFEISEEQALHNLCYQLITGDSVDNIAGISGLGAVAANKILSEVEIKSALSRVFYEYQKKYGIVAGADAFVEMWTLVKLRMNRGKYFREKYAKAFNLINQLK